MPQPALLASCWTHAGDAAPQRGDEASPFELRERVEEIARAGWQGIGLVHADLRRAADGDGLAELASLIRVNGLEHVEIEFLGDWWTTGETRARSDAVRRDLLDAAGALGAATLKVSGDMSGVEMDRSRLIDSFGELSEQARAVGTRIALEPMPFSYFATIEEGAAFVSEVGHPAGGLIVDIWHVHRAGSSLGAVEAAIDPVHLFAVELNDASDPAPEDLWTDTVDHRRLPGEGDWDVPEFIRSMRRLGFDGPWGVEVLSDEQRAKSLHDAVTSAFEATIRVFESTDAR